MDKLRIVKLNNVNLPAGTPVDFNGQEVGHVVRNSEEGICEIAINSDIASQIIQSGKMSYSLEVVKV